MKFLIRLTGIIVCVLCFTNGSLTAQEQLRPLSSNMNLSLMKPNSAAAHQKTTVTGPDTIPFFDDFSYAYKTPYPTANHWIDSNVYVNTGFATGPPSIGVATFDGLNKYGYPYNISAAASLSFPADKLTSRAINLKQTASHVYSPVDSIYLSFYFQAKGNGDPPEASDSLCVDFFKPNQNKWTKVWGKKGSTDTNFYMVMIPIKDTAYFDSSFVFRFRNNGGITGSVDHWNIDYVYIDMNRRWVDTAAFGDMAFAMPPGSFLKNYTSMPYRQYKATEMGTTFKNYFRSNFDNNVFMNYQFNVYDPVGNPAGSQNLGPVLNPGVAPYETNGYYAGLPHAKPTISIAPFSDPMVAPADYKVEHILFTSGDRWRPNDTVVVTQKFSNYYAYDDGTAEQAYYLNYYGAKSALRFTINVADTLRAMRIYFDPIVNGNAILNSTFRMMVWADGSNGPGALIHKDSAVNPFYASGGYNWIPTYHLSSCLLLNPGTYYVGIQQTTNQPLNIGFDRNTDHTDALYYDIGNGWTKSSIPGGGSLMINPVMGCVDPLLVGVKDLYKNTVLNLYPNPARDMITVTSGDVLFEDATVSISNSIGQTVYSAPFTNTQTISVSDLPNGIYFVQINDKSQTVSPKKLIISR